MKANHWLTYVVAGLALAGSIYLFQFDGWRQLKDFIKPPSIEVRSTSSVFSERFLSGEKLRFGLANVETARVFWVFDEAQVVPGDVEIEYLFSYSPDIPSGQASDHRVDAFYKVGGNYRSAKRLVRVQNIDVQATIESLVDELRLSYSEQALGPFQLSNAMLASYRDGRFENGSPVELASGSTSSPSESDEVDITWQVAPDFIHQYRELSAGTGRAWLQVEFTNMSTQERLVLVNPIDAASSQPE